MSASNGVYPPSCVTTCTPSTKTVAQWVTASKCSSTRRFDQPRGIHTVRRYQTGPT